MLDRKKFEKPKLLTKIYLLHSDKSAPKKISGGKNAIANRVDPDVGSEIWTGALMGLLITVLFLGFIIGFLIRLQANRSRVQRYNQETSLATLTGDNTNCNNMLKEKSEDDDDNLTKLGGDHASYSKQRGRIQKQLLTSAVLSQGTLSCASPTDPDVVQLHLPSTGK